MKIVDKYKQQLVEICRSVDGLLVDYFVVSALRINIAKELEMTLIDT